MGSHVSSSAFDLDSAPGQLLRRAQQLHAAIFSQTVSDEQLTTPQFAVLAVLSGDSPLDQRTLGERLGIDRSTVADVSSRLAERGLITRARDREDARRNLLALTEAGHRVHDASAPEMSEVGRRLLEPLSTADRQHLVRCLTIMITTHERRATYRDRPPRRD